MHVAVLTVTRLGQLATADLYIYQTQIDIHNHAMAAAVFMPHIFQFFINNLSSGTNVHCL